MAPEQPPKIAKVTDGSFAALIRAFMHSEKFMRYADGTKDTWGRELRFAAREDVLGAVSLQTIRPALIQAFLDGLTGRPGKQAVAYSVLKQVEKYALVRDLVPRTFMDGVETERPQGGHLPWTDEDVALAEKHARADLARAVTLGANTGQRGSDLIRMCPTDIEVYQGVEGINVVQKKTGREVWVPITAPLAAAMRTWERRPSPYLVRLDGSPWDRAALTHAWDWEKESNPALVSIKEKGLVLHGLRGTACVRLKRAGAKTEQIADMVGMSGPMVARYCRLSLQKENALAAIYHLRRTTGERDDDMSGNAAS